MEALARAGDKWAKLLKDGADAVVEEARILSV